MDAASMCSRGALKMIARNFTDPRVGAVAGTLQFVTDQDSLVTESQKLYWSYETFLKRYESRLGALVGADGPLYAVRRDLYRYIDPALISDFITPLLVRQQGYAVVLEKHALAFEYATRTSSDELNTRKRIIIRALDSLFRHPDSFNVFHDRILFVQIIARKVLRWLGGILFLCMITAAAVLSTDPVYLALLVSLLLFVISGIPGLFVPGMKSGLFRIPYYFLLVHFAGLAAFIDFLAGKRVVKWQPVRE
jgi:cellulose synthase/poly-beta-1,6-N-acetylglucosamine synthase-like glycosyltransferase